MITEILLLNVYISFLHLNRDFDLKSPDTIVQLRTELNRKIGFDSDFFYVYMYTDE